MTKTMSEIPVKAELRALNRIIVACYAEVAAFEEAAGVIHGGEGTLRLQQLARRRANFLRDLRSGVVALGKVPAAGPSYAVKLASGWRYLKRFLVGSHAGDAYRVCAGATAKTMLAYANALDVELPSDVRFGLEHQYREVQLDWEELRRRRWGATPRRSKQEIPDAETAPFADAERDQALQSWDDDGGRGERNRTAREPARASAIIAPIPEEPLANR